jgi:GNAT superfamily N-acetyltransferase
MQSSTRLATSSDSVAVAELYLRARRAGSARGTIPALVHDDDDVRHWVAHVVIPRLECWLAERVSGPVVGMLVLEGDWIDQLYVDPDLTGAGIGAELIAVAKRRRPDGLRLWTFVSNEAAQRFYLRHGFHEVERTDGSRNEEGVPDIQYAWDPLERARRMTPGIRRS